jgi:solute carrier family 25 iron transporter 28/37
MAEPIPPVEVEEIDYESLGGGSLTSNLLAGAFAGIMVCVVVGAVRGALGRSVNGCE